MGHKGNGIDIDVDLAFDNFDILLVEFFYVSTFLPMCDIPTLLTKMLTSISLILEKTLS